MLQCFEGSWCATWHLCARGMTHYACVSWDVSTYVELGLSLHGKGRGRLPVVLRLFLYVHLSGDNSRDRYIKPCGRTRIPVPCTLWLLFFFFSFPVRISLVGSPSWAPATCSLFDVPYPLPVISHRVLSRSILRPTQCTLMMFS